MKHRRSSIAVVLMILAVVGLRVHAAINIPALWVRLVHGVDVQAPEPEWGLKLVSTYDGYFFR